MGQSLSLLFYWHEFCIYTRKKVAEHQNNHRISQYNKDLIQIRNSLFSN